MELVIRVHLMKLIFNQFLVLITISTKLLTNIAIITLIQIIIIKINSIMICKIAALYFSKSHLTTKPTINKKMNLKWKMIIWEESMDKMIIWVLGVIKMTGKFQSKMNQWSSAIIDLNLLMPNFKIQAD